MAELQRNLEMTAATMRRPAPRPSGDGALLSVLEQDGGRWLTSSMGVEELLKLRRIQKQDNPQLCVIFAQSRTLAASPSLRQGLSSRYSIPPCFWTDTIANAPGYFGCQDSYSEDGGAQGHNTWFRFLVKQPFTNGATASYEWYIMSFATKWLPSNQNVALCFDAPPILQNRLRASLASSQESPGFPDPYSLHRVIIEEILAIYDIAVWSLRDLTRAVERRRTEILPEQYDYPYLHEIARHIIHSSEVLETAIDTMDSIIQQHELFIAERSPNINGNPDSHPSFRQTGKYLQFQFKLFKALRGRSQANGERLRSEIGMAFNTVAQHDSRIAVRIGRAARADSAAMKTIALLTLLFLPGTYISANFSMSFYNFSPGSET
ncbi:MAG: hypothetical protein M1839_001712 [Geoglossum umbratile]|nr:MAG: hypothetical protein M1839_001712 [Geoglossum umbratile]